MHTVYVNNLRGTDNIQLTFLLDIVVVSKLTFWQLTQKHIN